MNSNFPRPILGFVAFSGTGKTTLLEQLIPALRQRGLRTALLKHAHHDLEVDTPGKDSYRLRKAGATQVMVASAKRWALFNEHDEARAEPCLAELLCHLDTTHFDLLLVEGFKHEAYPKIELHRPSLGKDLIYPEDDTIVAIATDEPDKLDTRLPILDINQPGAIANFILAHVLGRADA